MINPYLPNPYHPLPSDESISNFRGVWCFSFLFCQLSDCYRDKRKCACDVGKIGIYKAIKNEKKSTITNRSKIFDQTAITSSPNTQNAFKRFF